MNAEHTRSQNAAPLTLGRRAFLIGVSAAGVSAVVAARSLDVIGDGAAPVAAPPAKAPQPVGTVFLDMPYVDMSGTATPYTPPAVIGDPAAYAARTGYGVGHA